jgi:hypothetical protein
MTCVNLTTQLRVPVLQRRVRQHQDPCHLRQRVCPCGQLGRLGYLPIQPCVHPRLSRRQRRRLVSRSLCYYFRSALMPQRVIQAQLDLHASGEHVLQRLAWYLDRIAGAIRRRDRYRLGHLCQEHLDEQRREWRPHQGLCR